MTGEYPKVVVEEPPAKEPEAFEEQPTKELPAKEPDIEESMDNDEPKKLEEEDLAAQTVKRTFPIREITLSLPFLKDDLRFNWLVSILGLGALWGRRVQG